MSKDLSNKNTQLQDDDSDLDDLLDGKVLQNPYTLFF